METVEKKTKSLTLKTRTAVQESTDESSGDCSKFENLNLLTRKFQKFIKMKSRLKNQQGKRGKNKHDSGSTKFLCFGCGKQGHMKAECPSIATKDKAPEKKNNKSGKTSVLLQLGRTMLYRLVVLQKKRLKSIRV